VGVTPEPTPKPQLLTADTRRRILGAAEQYDDPRSAVMPALYAAQEQLGYLPDQAIAEVAEVLCLPDSEIGAVASFYTMYFRTPTARHIINLCCTLSCALRGAEGIREHLCRRLKIKVGENTPDGGFRLNEVECLGACDVAPAAMIDDDYYGNLTTEKIDHILRDLGWTEEGVERVE
jgi:NADH-quinone oxidoreductase subunit E